MVKTCLLVAVGYLIGYAIIELIIPAIRKFIEERRDK